MERFPETAKTPAEARRYYRGRALQLLCAGWSLDALDDLRDDRGAIYGVEASFRAADGIPHSSVFILDGHTGRGHLSRWFDTATHRFVSSSLCPRMRAWLDAKGIAYTLAPSPSDPCYLAIERTYGDRRASRSGRFYMDHIDEGMFLLTRIGAAQETLQAFCLHALVQSDDDLRTHLRHLDGLPSVPIALAMEYRHQANGHLSMHPPTVPDPGPLPEIAQMLVADKVQNRKDFEVYLRGRVHNSDRLDAYFQEWFTALDISEEDYATWVTELSTRSLQPVCVVRDGYAMRAVKATEA